MGTLTQGRENHFRGDAKRAELYTASDGTRILRANETDAIGEYGRFTSVDDDAHVRRDGPHRSPPESKLTEVR